MVSRLMLSYVNILVLQAYLCSIIVFYASGSLYLRVSLPSARAAKAKARYQRKRVTQSSASKYFSALRASELGKHNFLCATRARYQRKRLTQPGVAKNFLCIVRYKVATTKFSSVGKKPDATVIATVQAFGFIN